MPSSSQVPGQSPMDHKPETRHSLHVKECWLEPSPAEKECYLTGQFQYQGICCLTNVHLMSLRNVQIYMPLIVCLF